MLGSLRSATPFEIPLKVLEGCSDASPALVQHNRDRVAVAESDIKAALLPNIPIPPQRWPVVIPVLGSIAEAVVESILVERGWQPLYNDGAGFSFGHGVDLLMLDPELSRVVAIEVKSTTQQSRWPRLLAGRREQLTPAWFDRTANQGMVEWDLKATDIFAMVAQVHFRRRAWRSCFFVESGGVWPVSLSEQLSDLTWLA